MNEQSPLVALGALGPFFAVDQHARHAAPTGPWQPLTGLLRPIGVRERIDQVRGVLANTAGRAPTDIPWRVAASVAHLGLVARLVSPPLGARISEGGELTLRPAVTWWQPVVGGPVPLSVILDAPAPLSGDPGSVVGDAALTLTELFAAESLSPRVLWGNVASAVNGAFNAISSVRAEATDVARMHVLRALEHPLLRGMSNGRPGPAFRRTNCCLIYRLGSPAQARQVCGDCVLSTATTDRQ